jgi:D-glycero-D-manno-heptose 1,7-bisphosphate phosphatase
MTRALFLDRDGILDELVFYENTGAYEAPRTLDDLHMIEGVSGPLRRFADAGWLLFIVTNQPNVAKGKARREDVESVNQRVVELLDVPIARSYICFHQAEELCVCRKPSPYFLHQAQNEFGVDLERSWMVGDQDSDLACGRAAGCKVALIEHHGSAHKRGSVEPDLRVNDLEELANALIPTSSATP